MSETVKVMQEMVKEARTIQLLLRRSGARARERVCHPEGGELRTKRGLRDQTDINRIMDRWLKHGTSVAHLNPNVATYGDFSSGLDYREALTAVKAAEADFAALPAQVRAHVGNDPGEFLQMIFDPERRDELEGLGLVADRRGEGDSPSPSGPGDAPTEPVKGVHPGSTVVEDGVTKVVPQGEN